QHVVMVSWPAIGHARPMLDFATSLLSDLPNLTVTFICSTYQIKTLEKLKIFKSDSSSSSLTNRLRFLGLGRSEEELSLELKKAYSNGETAKNGVEPEVILTMQAAQILSTRFGAIYQDLVDNREIKDDQGKTLLGPTPYGPPSLVICNWMISKVGQIVKDTTPGVRLMTFFDNAATFVTRMLGPVSIGGFGGVQERWEKYLAENPDANPEDAELKEKLFGRRYQGHFEIPGTNIQRMYESDQSPQAKDYLLKVPLTPSLVEIQKLVELSDVLLINTHESIEGPILAYLCSVVKKDVFAIGSVMFREFVNLGKVMAAGPEKSIEYPKDDEVTRFLDRHPKGSVLYISFGTMFRPTPEQIVQMLEILVEEESDTPFVWTLGSGKNLIESCTDELREKVRSLQKRFTESGKGLLVDWANQHAALQHSSVGFFLSHGGWNSSQEAVLAGKPLLVFPFFGDQVFDAQLLKSLNVAYHIQSSRFEPPEKFLKSYRYAVSLCRPASPHGDVLRWNAEVLKRRVFEEREMVEV
ncbi:UDP-Glycosyltransferase/glycogen phosphorylase, partial [Violaceomyces palustris]